MPTDNGHYVPSHCIASSASVACSSRISHSCPRRLARVSRPVRQRPRRGCRRRNADRPAAHLERDGKRPLEDADSASRLVDARRHGWPNLADHGDRGWPRFFAICVDAETGKVLHNKKLFHATSPSRSETSSIATPRRRRPLNRAACTSISAATAPPASTRRTGDVLWQRDDLPCRHYRGPSSSVVLFENLVILTFDGVDLQYVDALEQRHRRDGLEDGSRR